MSVSRTMWLRGLSEDYAKMRSNAVRDRNEGRKLLEERRKIAVKSAEDQHKIAVGDLIAKFNKEIADLAEMYKRDIAQGPPKD